MPLCENRGIFILVYLFINISYETMRKFKITEEQRQYAIKEGLTLNADVDAAGGDVRKAVETTKQQAQKSGVDPKKATIQIPPSNESRIITKKQMMENRLKKFKSNSDYFTVNEFMKRLGKKSVNEDFGGEPTQEEYIVREVGNALRPLGNMRQGFKSCSTRQVIEVMKQSGWNFVDMVKDSDEDFELYFSNGKDEAVIHYDNFYFKIRNIHSV